MKTLIALLLLLPSLSWGLGENIKNNKDVIKEEIQNKVEGVGSHNNSSSVSSANKELIHQFKNNFTTIEDLEEALTSAVKEQGKEKLIEDIQTTIEKKVIVAENLYKKLNEDDLNEIANLLIALEVLDRTSPLNLNKNFKMIICPRIGHVISSLLFASLKVVTKVSAAYSKVCG
jgi:hypothetical protein